MSYLLSYISKMLCIKIPSEARQASEDGGSGGLTECSVCLSRIRVGEATRRLPCRHAFHRDCVDRWLALYCRRRTCPLCRLHVGGAVVAAAVAGLDELQLGDDLVIWFSSLFVAGF